MRKPIYVMCVLSVNFLISTTVFGEWFSPERTGRITESGDEAFTCVPSQMTPRELIEEVRAAGGTYEVVQERVDEDTGRVKFTFIKVNYPGLDSATLMFFTSITVCRFMVSALPQMELDNLDRYK